MKLLVDGRWLDGHSGIARYANAICSRLSKAIDVRVMHPRGHHAAVLAPIRLTKDLRFEKPDRLFWTPGFIPPAFTKLRTICTVHDLNHRAHYGKIKRTYYDVFLKPILQRTDQIITVSHTAKRDLQDWLMFSDDERIKVIYHGVDPAFSPKQRKPEAGKSSSRPYFFYPGNFRRYKNVERIIEALARSHHRGEAELHFTSPPTPALEHLIQDLSLTDDVVFRPNLAEHELVEAYRNAHATVFISLAEGFGLPLLESMACGTPVISGTLSCLPETGGEAAEYVDPLNVDAIANAMDRLLEDEALRAALVVNGLQRASQFTWEKSATEHMQTFLKFSP